jgi:hypothetical protein
MLWRSSWMGRVNCHAIPYFGCGRFTSSAAAECARLESNDVNNSTEQLCGGPQPA